MATSNFQEVELDEVVHIALVGEAETGKSSFVHALKRLIYRLPLDEDEDEAETSVPATPSIPKCYDYPGVENVKLWDLPSLGTGEFSTFNSYCGQLELTTDKYDAFLIFTKTRLTNESFRLARRLEANNKRFFFIRSHIDEDVENERSKTKQEAFNEDTMLDDTRTHIMEKLKDLKSFSRQHIFFISNFQPELWDFSRLNDELKKLAVESRACLDPTIVLNRVKMTVTEKLEDWKKNKYKKREFSETHVELKERVEDEGIKAAQEIILGKIEINLAIIGQAGTGKSSFINAIRGVEEFDDPPENVPVAKTHACKETTMEPTMYPYPGNPNIKLWDQPGIGTDTFPDLASYCKIVKIDEYDAFIYMHATRFHKLVGDFAKEVHSMNKPFFFVRAKIDQDCKNDKRTRKSKFNEVTTLKESRDACAEKAKEIDKEFDDNDIFLISNHFPHKWDFPRLTTAILTRLPPHKQEAFCLSMLVLSEDILDRKVKRLKGWKMFGKVFRAMLPKPFRSVIGERMKSYKKDFGIIVEKVNDYRSKLGFPEEDSKEFEAMSDELKKSVRRYYLTNDINIKSWLDKLGEKIDKEKNAEQIAKKKRAHLEHDTAPLTSEACTSQDCENIKKVLPEKVGEVYDDAGKSDGSGVRKSVGEDGDDNECPPWLDVDEAKKHYYIFLYGSLQLVLEEMKKVAFEILKEAAARGEPEMLGIE